jgi:hypothetical protein
MGQKSGVVLQQPQLSFIVQRHEEQIGALQLCEQQLTIACEA